VLYYKRERLILYFNCSRFSVGVRWVEISIGRSKEAHPQGGIELLKVKSSI